MLHTIYYDLKHRSPYIFKQQNTNNVYLSAQVNTLQYNNTVDNKTLNCSNLYNHIYNKILDYDWFSELLFDT